MPSRALVLASSSPARFRLLTDAGFAVERRDSGVDEEAVQADDPRERVRLLGVAKAEAVAARLGDELVVGCDSMLLLDGELLGKAADAAEVTRRWGRMRGRTGELLTGHCVVDGRTGRSVSATAATLVRFGMPDEAEIAAYSRTAEATAVAGSFTLDGRAAPFVAGIEGDPGTVIGLSLPLLRDLLAQLGVRVTDLWC